MFVETYVIMELNESLYLPPCSVEVQFPHVSDALLEQLGYQKKNRYSASAFKVHFVK